jgi:hypothetical protein
MQLTTPTLREVEDLQEFTLAEGHGRKFIHKSRCRVELSENMAEVKLSPAAAFHKKAAHIFSPCRAFIVNRHNPNPP